MQLFVRAAIMLSAALAAPASAALIQYDFTAGVVGSYARSVTESFSPAQGNLRTDLVDNGNFSLSVRFVFDTEKAAQAGYYVVEPGAQSSFGSLGGSPPFMSATATKTGGTLPIALATAAGGYSGFDAYEGNSAYFNQGGAGTTDGYVYEYHSNGAVARRYTAYEYITASITDGLLDFVLGEIDDLQVITGFGTTVPTGDNYLSIASAFEEILYDETGNVISSTRQTRDTFGRISSANVQLVDVPEPAALSLFGLGLLTLAASRRRSTVA